MFKQGELIAHNHHGIGTVKKVRRTEILGTTQTLITVKFHNEDLDVTMSAKRLEATARKVLDSAEAKSILRYLTDSQQRLSREFKTRNRNNHQRLISGDPYQLCDVVVGLTHLRSTRGSLSASDGEQLRRATEMLSTELGIALDMSGDQQTIQQEVLLAAAS